MINVTIKQMDAYCDSDFANTVVLTFDKWHQVVSVLQGLSTSALRDSKDSIEIRLAPEEGGEKIYEEEDC